MNTQRLFTISKKLHAEITSLKLVATIAQLVQQLGEAINTPNETTQRAVENTLKQLHDKLATASSNDFSPGIRAELEELKVNTRIPVNKLTGLGLSQELSTAFADGYTSVQSLDKLQQLSKDIQSLANSLDHVNSSFGTLGMHDEELKPGESVVGMLIPREAVEASLLGLQREITFFARFLGMLTEVVEGHFDENEVYSLHASNFGIDVLTSLDVAARFATVIGGVKAAFDIIRGFRKLKENAENLGVDEELVEKLTEKGKITMEAKLDDIHAEVFQDCKMDDDGRVHELKTGIRLSLNGLANRLDRGFTFEVRTALPEGSPEEAQKQAAHVKAFSTIRFERLEGVRVLTLPEAEEETEKDDGGSKTAKKRQTRKPRTE